MKQTDALLALKAENKLLKQQLKESQGIALAIAKIYHDSIPLFRT
jgi:hypothetical protein